MYFRRIYQHKNALILYFLLKWCHCALRPSHRLWCNPWSLDIEDSIQSLTDSCRKRCDCVALNLHHYLSSLVYQHAIACRAISPELNRPHRHPDKHIHRNKPSKIITSLSRMTIKMTFILTTENSYFDSLELVSELGIIDSNNGFWFLVNCIPFE